MTTEGALCVAVAATWFAVITFVVLRGPDPKPFDAPLTWGSSR